MRAWATVHREELIAVGIIAVVMTVVLVIALHTQGRLLEFLMPRLWEAPDAWRP